MSKVDPSVLALEGKIVQDDNLAPSIEAPNEAVTFDGEWKSTNYLSAPAYKTEFEGTDFGGELKEFSDIWSLIAEGKKLVAMLYTFRSCSGALKDVKTAVQDEQRKREIYHAQFNILEPEIKKLNNLMLFHDRVIQKMKELVTSLVKPEKQVAVHSQIKLDLMIMLIDLLIKLDKLKDMKSNLVNDFSQFKRAASQIRRDFSEEKKVEVESIVFKLQSFLCNPANPYGLIIYNLKEQIHKVKGGPEIICLLINHCKAAIKNQRYLLPDEENRFRRAVVYLMYILDHDDAKAASPSTFKGINAFKYKLCSFPEVLRVFKETPVVPLFGDMQIQIKYDLDRCPHWTQDYKDRIDDKSRSIRQKYSLLHHHEQIRKENSAYTSRFCSLMNRIQAIKRSKTGTIDTKICEETFRTVTDGIRYISSWNGKIMLQSSYKYAHPLDEKSYKDKGGSGKPGHEYEKVVRYAYSYQEKSCLVDVVGMIKGLGSLLQRSESVFIDLCWGHIHNKMQTFLHEQLARPLRKAYKARRSKVLNIMLELRNMGGDYLEGKELKDDYKNKKADILSTTYDFPKRFTPPTVDQLVLLRRMMNFIADDRAEGMRGKGGMFGAKRDLKKEWQEQWKRLYNESYFFKYLLNFKKTLREAMDLSYLWYREFYLNMTKQPQFPIEMSMPWILTKFVIKGVQMKENLFYPMEIYNDAAEMALAFLDQRYMFDEIEAEVNLVFDQLIVHLAEEIFKYFKTLAGTMLVDREFRDAYKLLKAGKMEVPVSRYSTLMAQRTVRLLGRVVNLQQLLAQHVLSSFRQNIEAILAKFCANPLSVAVEIKSHMDNARLAHALASAHLPLDPFDSIVKETDKRVSLQQGCGRMTAHFAEELAFDIIPNWTYCSGTRRFLPSLQCYAEKIARAPSRARVKKHFWHGVGLQGLNSQLMSGYKRYFGAEHIHALLDLLDVSDVSYLMNEIVSHIEKLLVDDVMQSVEKVQKSLRGVAISLPKAHLGPALAYSSLQANKLIQALRAWKHLKPVFFNAIREIGNAFAFVHLLETCIHERDTTTFSQVSFYLAVRPAGKKKESKDEKAGSDLSAFDVDVKSASPFYTIVSQTDGKMGGTKILNAQIGANIQKTETFMKGHLEVDRSIFSAALKRLSDALETLQVFDGAPPSNGVLDMHTCSDFARVFSVAQFLFCTSPLEDAKDKTRLKNVLEEHSILGDGFMWGGCILVHLLGYAHRFEMLDLTYHILNIDEMYSRPDLPPSAMQSIQKDSPSGLNVGSLQTKAMKQFMVNARRTRQINNFVFSTINSYITVNPERPLVFSPPKQQ